jgi:hypothetical protein
MLVEWLDDQILEMTIELDLDDMGRDRQHANQLVSLVLTAHLPERYDMR